MELIRYLIKAIQASLHCWPLTYTHLLTPNPIPDLKPNPNPHLNPSSKPKWYCKPKAYHRPNSLNKTCKMAATIHSQSACTCSFTFACTCFNYWAKQSDNVFHITFRQRNFEEYLGKECRPRPGVMGSAYPRAELTTEYYCACATYLFIRVWWVYRVSWYLVLNLAYFNKCNNFFATSASLLCVAVHF